MKSFSFFDCYYTMIAHFFIKIGQNLTNFFISIGRNSCYIEDSFFSLYRSWSCLQLLAYMFNCHVDSPLQVSWVHSCLDFLISFFIDCSCQNSSSCCSISSFIICLVCNIFDKGGSNVGGFVGEVDSFGYCDSVFGDFGRSIALIDENISASRSKGDFYCIAELFASLE